MLVKQVTNEVNKDKFKSRIEVHLYINEWTSLIVQLRYNNQNLPMDYLHSIPHLATKLLVIITAHVKNLIFNWFVGMVKGEFTDQDFHTYLPCWKCYAEISHLESYNKGEVNDFIMIFVQSGFKG